MDLSKIYAPRPDLAHKGNFGSVLVICGSKFYSGSATLAAVGAARSGCDLVTVVAPQRACDVAAHTLPDLITYPLRGDFLTTRHIGDIADIALIRKVNSIVIGCGLGRHVSTLAAIRRLISKFNVPLVLDADALLAVSENSQVVLGKHFVMTPHAGELATLLGSSPIGNDFAQRVNFSKQAALKYQGVVLLKGHIDIVTDGESMITNNSGTPLMAKGGFGDILAGIVAALLARGVGLFEAACAAAYINGRAGELAAFDRGESLVASDIFSYIWKAVESSKG